MAIAIFKDEEVPMGVRIGISNTRNGDMDNYGSFQQGAATLTEVFALPEEIEAAIIELKEQIKEERAASSFHSSVDRVLNPNKVMNGQVTLSQAGVAQELAGSVPFKSLAHCEIKASSTNEGPVYIGSAATGVNSTNGRELDPGEVTVASIDDLSKLEVYSSAPGNSVSYIAFVEQ